MLFELGGHPPGRRLHAGTLRRRVAGDRRSALEPAVHHTGRHHVADPAPLRGHGDPDRPRQRRDRVPRQPGRRRLDHRGRLAHRRGRAPHDQRRHQRGRPLRALAPEQRPVLRPRSGHRRGTLDQPSAPSRERLDSCGPATPSSRWRTTPSWWSWPTAAAGSTPCNATRWPTARPGRRRRSPATGSSSRTSRRWRSGRSTDRGAARRLRREWAE